MTIPAGKTATVTFTGAEAKKWDALYVDVYSQMPFNLENKFSQGKIGAYAAAQIPVGLGGTFHASFPFPYPNALAVSVFGPATFSLVITDVDLPPGWSLSSLSPQEFTLLFGESPGQERHDQL